jgi:hypothetical protein
LSACNDAQRPPLAEVAALAALLMIKELKLNKMFFRFISVRPAAIVASKYY